MTDPEQAQSDLDALLDSWLASTADFARSFNIVNKRQEFVPFEPSRPQLTTFDVLDTYARSMFLKGRQMWITSAVVIVVLKLCLFRPGSRVCVAAHNGRTAVEINEFYKRMYDGNPALTMLLPLIKANESKIKFANGSQILFGTANSEFWRGAPTHFGHLTEAAMYDSLGDTLASLGKMIPQGTGSICIETTANGENDFHAMWSDGQSDYFHQFLCWLHHTEYTSDSPLPDNLTDIEIAYIREHQLTQGQASWWVRERRGMPPNKRDLMDQEFPPTPASAFKLSGDKFLRRQVPAVPARIVNEGGIVILHAYNPRHRYAAGVDTGSGSANGDASTVVIGDLTDRVVAATMQIRKPTTEFKQEARKFLAEFHDPVTAVETNSYGLEVCDYLRSMGVPMYHMPDFGGLAMTLRPQHGWYTNMQTRPILYGFIHDAATGPDRWTIECHRTVAELNALCYDKHAKPGAPNNGHDDLAVGFGLMIGATAQASEPEKVDAAQDDVRSGAQRYDDMLESSQQESATWYYGVNIAQAGDFFD